MLGKTLLVDHGTSRARLLSVPGEYVEVRVFYLMRDGYARLQSATS
jgi:hypothetical protein